MQINKKYLKITSIIAAILIVFGFFLHWLYSGQLTPLKISIFKRWAWPLALVNSRAIPVSEFITRLELSQNQNENNVETKQNIYNQLIKEEELTQIAQSRLIFVNQKQIDSEYQYRAGRIDLQGQGNFEQLLAQKNISQNFYKNEIIRPELLLSNLQVWFNSQKSLNQDVYTQADSLLAKISNGESMGSLAGQFTQDETGKNTQGDLGFVAATDLLPEMSEVVDNLKPGEVKIIPSRYGLHIIKLETKNGNLVNLRQIFLKTGDFDQWLKNEQLNFKVTKLFKI